jgi:tryptophanyl-tRNA synthetase
MLDNVMDWLSCGIDPEKSTIFIQSQVPEHLELSFVLSLITPLGLLERCPTYKEQLREVTNRDLSTYAFLGYPVLQAADILLYKADAVPVGEDQLPHLELTRQIARKFNHLYKSDYLDGRKMSKSYNNYIGLSEEPEVIRKKIQNMVTDPQRIRLSDPGHPHKCNVFRYYSIFFPERRHEAEQRCSRSLVGCTACKKELADKVLELLSPIQERRHKLLKDKKHIQEILSYGREKAVRFAGKTMREVRELLNI